MEAGWHPRKGCIGGSPLDDWLEEIGVIDSWLVDYVLATIDLWESDPDGGSANLDSEYPWFAVPEDASDSEQLAGLPFLPILIDRYPRYRGPDDISGLNSRMKNLSIDDQEFLRDKMDAAGWFESLEEYDQRTTRDYLRQKANHMRQLRETIYGFGHTEGFKHASGLRWLLGGCHMPRLLAMSWLAA
jgi:hypothetical protein